MIINFFDIDNHINSIENGARETFLVEGDLSVGTGAFVSLVAKIAARTGVHGGNEHEIGGVGDVLVGARNGDRTVFEGLAEGFENRAGVFGDFVKEENTVMGKGNFTRGDMSTTTDDGDGAGRVMRCAEGALNGGVGGIAKEGMEFCDGDLFFGGRRW